jgi:hypothetical protein
MPRHLTQLSVFVSGPSDVESEKSATRSVIDQLNKQLEKTHSITLRGWLWPDDVRPGVNTDPQAEINRQIGLTYDIYVGILSTRFGTSTPRAGSGTEEEFLAALSRHRENSSQVRLLFYFRRNTEDPYSIDLGELQRVKSFRESLSPQGVLYRDFRDPSDFVQQLKEHLYNLVVDEWDGSSWRQTMHPRSEQIQGQQFGSDAVPSSMENSATLPGVAEAPSSAPPDDSELELGILDYAEGFHQAVGSLEETLVRLATHTSKFTERFQEKALSAETVQREIERLKNIGGSRNQQELVARARKVVDEAAVVLKEYVDEMTPELQRYRSDNESLFGNYLLLIKSTSAPEMYLRSSDEDRVALLQLIQTLVSNQQLVAGFQESIVRLPPLTGRFKRARSQAASMLGEFIAQISFSIDEVRQVLRSLGDPREDNAEDS